MTENRLCSPDLCSHVWLTWSLQSCVNWHSALSVWRVTWGSTFIDKLRVGSIDISWAMCLTYWMWLLIRMLKLLELTCAWSWFCLNNEDLLPGDSDHILKAGNNLFSKLNLLKQLPVLLPHPVCCLKRIFSFFSLDSSSGQVGPQGILDFPPTSQASWNCPHPRPRLLIYKIDEIV